MRIICAEIAFAISYRESGRPSIRGTLPTCERIALAPLSLLARLTLAPVCAVPSCRAEGWRHAVVAGARWHGSRRRPGRLQNFGTLRSRSPESHALLLHIASPGARLGRGFFIAKRRARSATTKTTNFPGLAPPVAVTHRLGRHAALQVPISLVKMFENNLCACFPNVSQVLCDAVFFSK